jgi:hypothetical protein
MQPFSVTMHAASLAAADKADRRRYPRATVNRPARLRVAGGPASPAQLMNISPLGAALFCSAPLAAGTEVELQLKLPTLPANLELHAVVRQSHLLGESHLVRVAFARPSRAAVEAILRFMDGKRSANA